jgi:peptidoglycan/xylan/chitin deacetylase (PgdA/CDA1 family)
VDDGYQDFWEVAFPVLRETGVPAMVFVTTGFVDGRLMLWWDRLEQLLDYGSGQVLTFELDGAFLSLDLTTKVSRKRVWHLIADRCRFLPHAEKEALIEKLATVLDYPGSDQQNGRYRGLSWSEIKLMSQSNIQFGAHTVSHPILSRLQVPLAQAEIVQSKERLSEVLQGNVDWFCYPQGGPADYTSGIKELVRAAGFKGSYVAHQNVEHENDLFTLPRYSASSDMVDFRWALCGAEYLVLKCRALLGRPSRPGQAYWSGSESLASPALSTAGVLQAGAKLNRKSCSEN